jgi:hypothetical protein
MTNMSYCRHENTANDLQDVVDRWNDFDPDDATPYEIDGRRRIVELAREIAEMEA